MKKLFAIAIGVDDEGMYFANVHSMSDNKIAPVKAKTMYRVLKEVNKLVSDKAREVKNFPLPEPSRIITPNGTGGPKLSIVTP